ncbi:hypothetical protein KIPB_003861 [Kipferlia bialata]|uniref:Uncharacterized protein n=1 Tax=Kipferlia bialata TaxID=797122 RepID=A0A9K3CSY7_9EUKA|nr:hypothetical protein KIPB_003861 [Kipferlia bialata]|eukprot:g3861.t1
MSYQRDSVYPTTQQTPRLFRLPTLPVWEVQAIPSPLLDVIHSGPSPVYTGVLIALAGLISFISFLPHSDGNASASSYLLAIVATVVVPTSLILVLTVLTNLGIRAYREGRTVCRPVQNGVLFTPVTLTALAMSSLVGVVPLLAGSLCFCIMVDPPFEFVNNTNNTKGLVLSGLMLVSAPLVVLPASLFVRRISFQFSCNTHSLVPPLQWFSIGITDMGTIPATVSLSPSSVPMNAVCLDSIMAVHVVQTLCGIRLSRFSQRQAADAGERISGDRAQTYFYSLGITLQGRANRYALIFRTNNRGLFPGPEGLAFLKHVAGVDSRLCWSVTECEKLLLSLRGCTFYSAI